MQDLIVFLIVGAAFVYLARYFWLSSRGKAGCNCPNSGGACGGEVKPKNDLVQIDLNGSFKK